jgi:hypothetical protein
MPKRDNDKPDDQSGDTRPGLSPMRLARALFTQQVRLRRGENGLKVVLENSSAPRAAPPTPIVSDETVRALLMHTDLTALLDAAKGSRKVLRHLAAVEHGLEHKDAGALFLFEVPPERLKTALRQLDGLIVGSMSPGLSALRGRMLDAINAQEIRERRRALREPISTFLVDHKLQVVEARVTDFDQANAAWLPTLPPDRDTEPPLLEQIPNKPDPDR